MHLKEVHINGFKSFAQETIIEFDPGITGIVGPNGSGKSNVVDAIRWVLGEQSVKSLRGYGMSDVIFSGTKKRKAANIASVNLIFDNSDNHIPIEKTEISIKRKAYRDGINEYFLNNQLCRLKDITDLLLDSGLAKEGFNIISQGKIDEIITARPHERKIIFEEAAGVLKYKKRKEETWRKLDKTNLNITRLEDIILEIEDRLKPLTREKNKAERYEKLKKELTEKEIALLSYDINIANALFQEKKAKLKLVEEEIASLSSNSVLEETALSSEKELLNDLEKELNEFQLKLLEQTKIVEQLNSKKRILIERKKYQVDDQKKYDSSIILKEKQLNLSNQIKKLTEEQSTIQWQLSQNTEKTTVLKDDLSKISDQRNKTSVELANNLREEQFLKDQLEKIRESIERDSYMPAAVAKIINNPKLTTHRTVGEAIEVSEQYATAISTALGQMANNVIVDHEKQAKEAIRYLKEHNLGRVTFLPISILKERFVDQTTLNKIKGTTGFIDVANKLVKYQVIHQNILGNLLGNVLVVDNLDNANKLAAMVYYKYKIVTLSGEQISFGGAITGGKLKVSTAISERKLLEETAYKLKQITEKINLLEEKINALDNQFHDLSNQLFEQEKQITNLEVKKDRLEQLKNKDNEELAQVNDELNSDSNSIEKEEETVLNEYYQAIKEKETINNQIKNLQLKKNSLEKMVDEKEGDYRYKNKALFDKSKAQKDLEIEINRLDVRLDNNLNYLSEHYNMTFEYALNNYPLKDDETEVRDRVNDLKEKISKIGFVNLNAPSEFDEINERFQFLEKQKTDLKQSANNLVETIEELDKIMIKEFNKTFKEIQKHFAIVFKELFNGGEAYLELTNPENILETGVEIIAQPPGKKLTTISLLSGGEKSLAAISLLFAILKTRPVPFCVFDEVEAALDETNVDNFGNYIMKLKKETQFIIVTHKKKTMEFVDLLYGITMQESGVSKLVSVRLSDLD